MVLRLVEAIGEKISTSSFLLWLLFCQYWLLLLLPLLVFHQYVVAIRNTYSGQNVRCRFTSSFFWKVINLLLNKYIIHSQHAKSSLLNCNFNRVGRGPISSTTTNNTYNLIGRKAVQHILSTTTSNTYNLIGRKAVQHMRYIDVTRTNCSKQFHHSCQQELSNGKSSKACECLHIDLWGVWYCSAFVAEMSFYFFPVTNAKQLHTSRI